MPGIRANNRPLVDFLPENLWRNEQRLYVACRNGILSLGRVAHELVIQLTSKLPMTSKRPLSCRHWQTDRIRIQYDSVRNFVIDAYEHSAHFMRCPCAVRAKLNKGF